MREQVIHTVVLSHYFCTCSLLLKMLVADSNNIEVAVKNYNKDI